MLRILSLVLVVSAAVSGKDTCSHELRTRCDEDQNDQFTTTAHCNAQYGNFMDHLSDVQGFANLHLEQSFQFLVMASHFSTYRMNREGFHKYYQGLSDSLWEDGINIVKYVTKRGGHMINETANQPGLKVDLPDLSGPEHELELAELKSLAKALDLQKDIAKKTHAIHKSATQGQHHKDEDKKKKPDAELNWFLENNFVAKHAERIRELSGHFSNLKDIIRSTETPNLGIYLFDQLLK